MKNLTLPGDLPLERLANRRALVASLDKARDGGGSQDAGPGRASAGGLRPADGQQARKAFDISAEPAALRDRYGRHTFGQSALLRAGWSSTA